MKSFVCLNCPNGCQLTIDEVTNKVTGNRCKRGEDFAKNELVCPKRTVSSSVKTTIKGYNVVSVKTDKEIEKSKIMDLMKLLSKIVIKEKLPINSIIAKNVLGTDVNIILTKDMK